MSYNIVKKSGSTCLVKKFRDRENPKKVVERYMCSLGVQTDARHKEIRKQVNELAQEDRFGYCQRSGLIVEVSPDTPRRKAPTGDKRVSKPAKTRKKITKEEKEKIDEKTDIRPEKQSVVSEKEKVSGLNVGKYKTRGNKLNAINKRIEKINQDISFSKSVVKQKKGVATLSKTEQQSINTEIEYHQSVIDSGKNAVRILKKQKSTLR